MQYLILAEYYTFSFPADFIAILSYYIALLIICYIPIYAKYLVHMQCCWVSKMWHLIAAEYTINAALNKCFFFFLFLYSFT